MNDVSADRLDQSQGMRIELFIDGRDPPMGTLSVHGGNPMAFEGWLGLLGVLSTLTEAASEPWESGSDGGRSEAIG